MLAGSPSRVVYEQFNAGQRGIYGPGQLWVRNSRGKTRRLYTPPSRQILDETERVTWSLVGTYLTSDEPIFPPSANFDWWNVVTGAHGHGRVAPGDLIGSSPDGWVYLTEDSSRDTDEIFDQPASGGKPKLLSHIVVPNDDNLEPATSGPDGYGVILDGDDGTARLLYSTWGSPET